MASLNKIFLIGNLGADPEKRFTGNGTAVTTFRMATSTRWNDKAGQKQERTEWHRVVVFGPQAESTATYLSKGRPVFVEGEVRYRQYEDKAGVTKYMTEVVAQRVQFLGSAPGAGAGAAGAGTGSYAKKETPASEDSIAFPEVPESALAQEDDIPF